VASHGGVWECVVARPRKQDSERRTRSVGVRLTASERAALEAAAAARRQSPSEVLRTAFFAAHGAQASLHERMPSRELDPAAVLALNRVGANLNQLARRANIGGTLQPGEVPETLAAISQVLARLEALVFTAMDR
jgi:hypothetical protein